MSTDNKTNVNSDMPTDTKISTNTSNSDNGSTKSTDGSEANNKTFNEWLAGLIDGKVVFNYQRKGLLV